MSQHHRQQTVVLADFNARVEDCLVHLSSCIAPASRAGNSIDCVFESTTNDNGAQLHSFVVGNSLHYTTSDPPCWTFKMGQRYTRIDYVLLSHSLARR
eukprot:9722776-Prorocentrum_lima.AAC.1